MSKFFGDIRGTLCAVIVAAGLGASPCYSQGTVTLRLADMFPTSHIFSDAIAKPFMKSVTEATRGQVVFQHYPAQQLGAAKDLLKLTQSGVADIGLVVPVYISDALPLSGLYELPGEPHTACQGAAAFLSLASEAGILGRKEFAPLGVRALIGIVPPSQQVFTTTKKVTRLEDMKGLKLRTPGGAVEVTAAALGMVPVKISGPETSEAMRRGTIEGGILAHSSIDGYSLTDLIKYGTDGANFGTTVLIYAINERKFKSLPKNVQDTLVEEGRKATLEGCKKLEVAASESIDRWTKGGMTISVIDPADQSKLTDIFRKVRDDWARGLNRRGLPGDEVVTAFTAALEKAK